MIKRLFARLAARASGRELHVVRGFDVAVENSRADIATADVLSRLDESLAMIERYQPHRWWHLTRDVRYFAVIRYPCRGAFFPGERACMTELTFLARRDITAAPVASSILHEGIHARVHGMVSALGGAHDYRDRAREERLCRSAELVFGRALPAELGAPVIERALASLALGDEDVAPTIDWNVARRRMESADGSGDP